MMLKEWYLLWLQLVFVHVDLEDSDQAPGIIEFFGLKGDKPAVRFALFHLPEIGRALNNFEK